MKQFLFTKVSADEYFDALDFPKLRLLKNISVKGKSSQPGKSLMESRA